MEAQFQAYMDRNNKCSAEKSLEVLQQYFEQLNLGIKSGAFATEGENVNCR